MRTKVIGYIPLDRGSSTRGTRLSHLVDLTRAKNESDRLKKLAATAKVFNHHDKSKHDDDVKAGAVSILCNLLRSCSPFFVSQSKEVYWLCKILIQLYRCNEDRAKVSFCIDGSILLINLFEVIEVNYRLGKKGDALCLVVAQKTIDKLLSFACVPLSLIKRDDELMLSLMSNINGATGRIVMFMSMKCLSKLSEHKQNKQMLLKYPDFIKSVEVGSRHMSEAVRAESTRVICNLAWDTKNKAQIGHGKQQVMAKLIYTSLTKPSSSTASKQYAMKTLTYIASEVNNKMLIVDFEDGLILREAARLISDGSNFNTQVKISATELIGSLICRSTASKIACCHPRFLVALASIGCGKENAAVSSARVVKKLSTFIHSDDNCHEDLLQALVTLSYGLQTKVLKLIMTAYAEQAKYPQDRLKMVAQKGLLEALIMLSEDDNDAVRDLALFVISALAYDVATTKDISVNQVLGQLGSSNSCKSRRRPRCYSPTSISQFHFDFTSTDCALSLI